MDAVLAVLLILMDQAGVTALIGVDPTTGNPAIYGGQLPEHYNPEPPTSAEPTGDGPAITIVVKGGLTHSEMPLQEVDVQVTTWAGINSNVTARSVYVQVLFALHDLTNIVNNGGYVKRIIATVPGIDVVDPDTGWATCVAAFNVMIMPPKP
jgi:hypothetical protein